MTKTILKCKKCGCKPYREFCTDTSFYKLECCGWTVIEDSEEECVTDWNSDNKIKEPQSND